MKDVFQKIYQLTFKIDESLNNKELKFYIDQIEKHTNEDPVKIAARQFMKLCKGYMIADDKRVLAFFKKKLVDGGYILIYEQLFDYLLQIPKNIHDELR